MKVIESKSLYRYSIKPRNSNQDSPKKPNLIVHSTVNHIVPDIVKYLVLRLYSELSWKKHIKNKNIYRLENEGNQPVNRQRILLKDNSQL